MVYLRTAEIKHILFHEGVMALHIRYLLIQVPWACYQCLQKNANGYY